MKQLNSWRNCFAWLAASFAISVSVAAEPSLRVQFELHESEAGATGIIIVAVWDSPESYLEGDPSYSTHVKASSFPQEVEFHNLPVGVYAISAFLDENENLDLDTSTFGMPREPFGFSNNARNRFGPAHFKDARFQVEPGLTALQKIQLR